MQTYTAKLRTKIESAGFVFVKADIWECKSDDGSPEVYGAAKALGDLINNMANALGVDHE